MFLLLACVMEKNWGANVRINHRPKLRKTKWLKDSSGMNFLKCRVLRSKQKNWLVSSGFFMKKMAEEDYLEVSFLICICALKEARNCKGHLQIFLQIWPCQIEWWEEPCSKVPSYLIEGRTVCSQKLRAGYVVEKEGACWCCSFQHYQLPKISSFQMLMVFVQSVF